MARELNIIDADGHVLEPMDMWDRYCDPKFRGKVPGIVKRDGIEVLRIEENRILELPAELGLLGSIGSRDGDHVPFMPYSEGRPGGFDPHERIKDMDREQIDAAFLYPSLGLFLGTITDPEVAAAGCRAYNRWLADYCSEYPDRLFGIAMVPMQYIDKCIEELKFAVEELGFKGAFIRPNPYGNRYLHDPAYYPLWEVAQDLDIAIGLHEGTASGQPTLGADRFMGATAAQHLVGHTMEMMAAAAGIIMCGVCEKFPKLRFGFLEASGGWMAGWLDRMDRHYTDQGLNDTPLTCSPSETFRRQCFISFEPVEQSLKVLADYIGSENILWATDYPHLDGFWNAPNMIKKMGMPDATLKNILAQGAKNLYNLN